MKRVVPMLIALALASPAAAEPKPTAPGEPAQWRREHRIIDLHQHIGCTTQFLARTIKIMDAAGVGTVVNLSGGTVTPGPGDGPSEFEQNRQLADAFYPRRFVHYMSLDYAGWDDANYSERAVAQVEQGHRLGAA